MLFEDNEGNNHTSKINVFPVSHTILFTREWKMDLFALHREIKSTLWPASRTINFFLPRCIIYYFSLFSFTQFFVKTITKKSTWRGLCRIYSALILNSTLCNRGNKSFSRVAHDFFSTIGSESGFFCPARGNKVYFMAR